MPRYDDSRFSPPAPIAFVTLRNPNNDAQVPDVPMLIDSGADVTLLPQTLVERMGLDTKVGAAYELAGFDGSASTSVAVRVDLIWGRKTFRGLFLLTDQEWGILGRNLLNNLY